MRVAIALVGLLNAVTAQTTCPTKTTCPSNRAGQNCQFLKCPNRGGVAPVYGSFLLDQAQYSPCMARRSFSWDSHAGTQLEVEVDSGDYQGNPTLVVYGPTGAMLSGRTERNDGRSIEILYSIPSNGSFGNYMAVFTSANHSCSFKAIAIKATFQTAVGFSASNVDDMPSMQQQQNGYQYLVMAPVGLPYPGFALYAEIYENGRLLYSLPMYERFNCQYFYLAGPIVCITVHDYMYKIYGLDDQGYNWQRVSDIQCVASTTTTVLLSSTIALNTTTTTSMTTTSNTNQCYNGGFYNSNTGTCTCPYGYTGSYCENAICQNGGTPVTYTAYCTCPSGYTSTFCETPICPVYNTPASEQANHAPDNKAFVLVVQYTQSMATELCFLSDYIAPILDQLNDRDTAFLTSYMLVVYNDQTDVIAYAGGDPNKFIAAVQNLCARIPNTFGKCAKPVLSGVLTGLKGMATGGYMYVMTDSSSDDPSNSTLNVYNFIENTLAEVNFIVTPGGMDDSGNPCDTSSIAGLYQDISGFSGGVYYGLSTKQSFQQALSTIPYIYRQESVTIASFTDCFTSPVTLNVPMDAHTAAWTITVNGNAATVKVTDNNGTQPSNVYQLMADPSVQSFAVNQPCSSDAGWHQQGSLCYYANFNRVNWTTAQSKCAAYNAHMVAILNSETQNFLNFQTDGTSFWLGLNDRQQENSYVWDGPTNLPLSGYTNWAPGQPAADPNHQSNCVANLQNQTGSSAWYTQDCSQTYAYMCQKPAMDFNAQRLPSGSYTLQMRTTARSNGDNSCSVSIQANTDLVVFDGFVTNNTSDFPVDTPSGNGTSYEVATSTVAGSTINQINQLVAPVATYMTARSGCFYSYVSTTPFYCGSKYITMRFSGRDETNATFNRLRDVYCLNAGFKNLEERYKYLIH